MLCCWQIKILFDKIRFKLQLFRNKFVAFKENNEDLKSEEDRQKKKRKKIDNYILERLETTLSFNFHAFLIWYWSVLLKFYGSWNVSRSFLLVSKAAYYVLLLLSWKDWITKFNLQITKLLDLYQNIWLYYI